MIVVQNAETSVALGEMSPYASRSSRATKRSASRAMWSKKSGQNEAQSEPLSCALHAALVLDEALDARPRRARRRGDPVIAIPPVARRKESAWRRGFWYCRASSPGPAEVIAGHEQRDEQRMFHQLVRPEEDLRDGVRCIAGARPGQEDRLPRALVHGDAGR